MNGDALTDRNESPRVVPSERAPTTPAPASHELGDSEDWLSTILTSIGDAVIATDISERVTFVNPVAESLTGFTRAEMLARPLAASFRIVNEQTRAPMPLRRERALREGRSASLANHTLLIRKDGSEVPIDDSAAPIRGRDGQFIGAVVVFRDVTEKKRSEQALRELAAREKAAAAATELEREKLYSVFMQAPVAICMLEGPEHTFVFANPHYRAIVGGRDVVGKPLLEALPDIAEQKLDEVLDRVVATGEPFFGNEVTFKLAHHAPDEFSVLNFVYTPKRNAAGVIDGVLVSATDVTEQVLARRRVEAMADQLLRSEESLAHERDKLQTIFQMSPAAMAMWHGQDHVFEMVNPEFQAIFAGRELLHRPLLDAIPELGSQPFPKLLTDVLDTAEPYVGREVLTWIPRPVDGQLEERYYDFTYARVDDSEGSPYGVYVHAIDVTERMLARRRLEESEQRLQLALSGGRMGSWSILLPSNQLVSDERFRELHGNADPIAFDDALRERVHPDDRNRVRAALAEAIANATPYACEYRCIGATSKVRWIYARGECRYDDERRPTSISGVAFDIDVRRRAQETREKLLLELQRSEENVLALAEAIPQQVWTATADGLLDFVNQRVLDYFGKSETEVLGNGWQNHIHPDDVARCIARWQQALATGADYEADFRLRRFDGSYRWHLGRASSASDPLGRIGKWFGTNTDVDEAKRFRETLEQAQVVEQQLRHEAEQANRAKDDFLAMLGHEMRNPLAPITTALQLMKLRADDVFTRERTTIERQVDHLTRLVDDLLDVSRITSGKVEISRQPVNLAEVVSRALEMTSPLLEQRRHHLKVGVPAHGLVVDGDPLRLAQVVSNLLTNAAKYSELGGHIEISGAREGAEVVLRVRDQGVGIAPDMLPRVFEMFAQERQSIDRARGGLGLGLAIVRSLVKMHGGSVAAHSEGRGHGSEFVLRLPAAVEVSSPDVAAPEPRKSAPPASSRVRILIVDDNTDAAELLATTLEHLGYETNVAHDGPSALKLAEAFPPNLAVLDIGLPVMDGYELGKRLRQIPSLTKTRLVALTGYGQESDRRRSHEAGFDAHIVKPIQIATLEELIQGYAAT